MKWMTCQPSLAVSRHCPPFKQGATLQGSRLTLTDVPGWILDGVGSTLAVVGANAVVSTATVAIVGSGSGSSDSVGSNSTVSSAGCSVVTISKTSSSVVSTISGTSGSSVKITVISSGLSVAGASVNSSVISKSSVTASTTSCFEI